MGEVDAGAFRAGPEFFSFIRGTPLWPNSCLENSKKDLSTSELFRCSLFAFQ